MAAVTSVPAQGANPVKKPDATGIAQTDALALAVREPVPQPMKLSPPLARMPVELEVGVPVREFRVRNLLALNLGHVISTQWPQGDDLPLAAGEVQLAWSEFEVVDTTLAVRVTRLA